MPDMANNDVNDNAVKDLQAEIDKIDFDGGLAPGDVTSAASTQDPPVVKPEASDEPTPEPEPEPKDADPEPEPEPGEADPEPTPQDDDSEEDDKPALPDSHYRAAIRMGMTAEEISELYDASPATAVKAVAKCFEMVNRASQQLGALGRAAQQAQQKPQSGPQPQPQPEPQGSSRVNKLIEKVRDHYDGDDPMAEVLVELLKDRQPQAQPQPQPEPQSQGIPQRTVDEEIAARQQINTFFADEDIKPYEELYGTNSSTLGGWSHLTPGQRANRVEVCERAQMILYGAAAVGDQMGTAEALERAHLEISAPMAEQIVRSRIVSSAKRRERGLTLRPNSDRPPSSTKPGEYDKGQAVDEMKAELKKVFG